MIGKTVSDMLAALSGGETSEALVKAHLAQIQEHDAAVGAFLQVDEEGALQQAREVDRKRAAGEALGPLAGIPVALKDNINADGLHNTCGSKILEAVMAGSTVLSVSVGVLSLWWDVSD